MTEGAHLTHLFLTVEGVDADDVDLDRLTRRLVKELRDLDIESVEGVPGAPLSEGVMAGADPVTVNQILLATLPTVLPALILLLQGWLIRNQGESRRLIIKTKDGVEVSFTPEKNYSEVEILTLVNKLSGK